jgi:membrane protein
MIARTVAKDVVDEFQDNGLGTFASAIAFQVMTAIVPLALFGFGLVGFLDLREVWSRDLAPTVEESVTRPAFELLDQTVRDVLTHKNIAWVTFGSLLAIWQLSGAVRASMSALDRIYGAGKRRTLGETLTRSLWLAAAVTALVFAAIAVIVGTPLFLGDVSAPLAIALFIARWAIGGALLLLAVGLVVHFGPARAQDVGWTSVGSVLVVAAWAITSIGFGVYLSLVAGNSLFGHLVTVVVGLGYLYGASLAFLFGVQLDAVIRARAGDAPAPSPRAVETMSARPSRPAART